MSGDIGHTMLESWAEVLAALVLLIGFFIAIVIQSPALNYIVIILAGLLNGRLLYEKHRSQPIFPFILIIIGFLLGFMLGAIAANKVAIMVLYLLALGVSYWLHQKGYVEFFKTEGFIR